MELTDLTSLLNQVIIGEASDDEILRLSQLLDEDPGLTSRLRDELEFSEWIRLALRDHTQEFDHFLSDAVDQENLSVDERIQLARDGDLSRGGSDELARYLVDDPEKTKALRSDLFEDERIAQIVSPAKSETAFIDSLVTRMWAETSDDFVKDISRRIDQIELEENRLDTGIVSLPERKWQTRAAFVGALAAVMTVGAFLATSLFEIPSSHPQTANATIVKSTEDATWENGQHPEKGTRITVGTYHLKSGAFSLVSPDGSSLAIQGPATFEVDADGEAMLHDGIALATTVDVSPESSEKTADTIGIGLSARNIHFSKGAITVGIDARSRDATEAVVFSGETGICLTDGDKCRDVFQFEAIKADHNREKFIDVPYNPRAFSKAWELVSGVERNLGDVSIELPGTAADSGQSEKGEIKVFVENDRFRPIEPLEVDDIRPGLFATSGQQIEGRKVTPNEDMRSYLVQLWPENDDEKPVEASLTFDHPVVGVIISSDRLWESDNVVGATSKHVLLEQESRGLDPAEDEAVLLSEDGRTLNLKLKSGESKIDQIRVLVALKD